MPPRLSLQPLSRQLKPCTLQQRVAISSTSRNGALKFTSPSATKELMEMDEGSNGGSSGLSPGQPGQLTGNDRLTSLLEKSNAKQKIQFRKDDFAQSAKENTNSANLARQSTRNWKPGDIYAPHDLSPQEMRKWKAPKQPSKDIIDMLGLNPLDHYRNFSIMSEFMTTMGRIKHSKETGLRPVNQRKMAKAIRRSIGMGLHPSTHHHPMILFRNNGDQAPRYQNAKIPDPDRQRIKPV
ncbi:hypothetical protein KVR01_001186 [Diaporthe batatas]|uniref:mitochondrial 37S ribosomal protein RSM18 n=1 Tax=Diaporthe batatas TaxID=748121 RepID=UPI001D054BCD|nr:mitochondrial 37S ribosomal protein RSM18 [Diaporthe batatas]KAG8168437.1 hypothetical protein KVR01_001186 [Diaporthe batatas]